MSLALLKIQQFGTSCKHTISKNVFGLSQKNDSVIRINSEENETSVAEIIPFLYISRSVILTLNILIPDKVKKLS